MSNTECSSEVLSSARDAARQRLGAPAAEGQRQRVVRGSCGDAWESEKIPTASVVIALRALQPEDDRYERRPQAISEFFREAAARGGHATTTDAGARKEGNRGII